MDSNLSIPKIGIEKPGVAAPGFRFACRPQLELISFLPIAIIAYVIHQYNMQHPLIYKLQCMIKIYKKQIV